jgi:hypothetical protein
MTHGEGARDRDAQKLAELGYKQELSRAWSGFSNFAISFTIISVLAGCFTLYGQGWNNGATSSSRAPGTSAATIAGWAGCR